MGLHKMPTVKLFDILGVITKINIENFIETARICGVIAVQDSYIYSNTSSKKIYQTEDISKQTEFNSSSNLDLSGELETDLTASAKNLRLSNVNAMADNKTLYLTGTDNLEVLNLTKGGYHLAESIENGQIVVENSRIVKFSNLVFDENTMSHNGVEIGFIPKYPPLYVLFENCKFLGKFDNMAINVHSMQNNGVVDIKNCLFKNGAGIRFSNKTNAKNLTLNIIDCILEPGESHIPYPGEGDEFFLRLRDHESKSLEESLASNFYGPDKLKVNFKNLILPKGKLLTSDKDELFPGGKRNILNITLDEGISENRIVEYDPKVYPLVTIK